MRVDPVKLDTCLLIRDLLTRQIRLTIGVTNSRGRIVEECYEVRQAAGLVVLVKEDGTHHEVRTGGRCSCADAKYSRRLCKHATAVELAGLVEQQYDARGIGKPRGTLAEEQHGMSGGPDAGVHRGNGESRRSWVDC